MEMKRERERAREKRNRLIKDFFLKKKKNSRSKAG
jgi:hypothetical protein